MMTPQEIADYVCRTLIGWPGAKGNTLPHIAQAVIDSGDGDYVEIGSLFGASAITAAAAKMTRNFSGKVYCIDPMEFERHEAVVRLEGSESKRLLLKHQEQIFKDNIEKYPDIELVKACSDPWPIRSPERFDVAFIDGWHYGDGPITDAMNLVDIIDKFIILDDIIPHYPDVMRAFHYLAAHPRWFLRTKIDRAAIFVRRSNDVIFTEEGTRPAQSPRSPASTGWASSPLTASPHAAKQELPDPPRPRASAQVHRTAAAACLPHCRRPSYEPCAPPLPCRDRATNNIWHP